MKSLIVPDILSSSGNASYYHRLFTLSTRGAASTTFKIKQFLQLCQREVTHRFVKMKNVNLSACLIAGSVNTKTGRWDGREEKLQSSRRKKPRFCFFRHKTQRESLFGSVSLFLYVYLYLPRSPSSRSLELPGAIK